MSMPPFETMGGKCPFLAFTIDHGIICWLMKLGTEEKPIGRSVQNMHENKEEKIDRQGQRRHLDMSSQTLVSSVNSSVGWWEMWALGGATIYETKLSFCAWKESDRQVFGPVTACDVNSTDLTAHCAAVWLCSKTCVVLQSGGLSGIKYIRHVAHLWKEQRSVPPSISLKTKTNKKKKRTQSHLVQMLIVCSFSQSCVFLPSVQTLFHLTFSVSMLSRSMSGEATQQRHSFCVVRETLSAATVRKRHQPTLCGESTCSKWKRVQD